ncbi:hypothetical protein EVAR_62568_1 [Eumeta japonica]|uniref:Uncharacterized protein n=1 Tax=Eumeta variegata TaxID=151549 RepID=A0A4C1YRF2_EUMVA|nr:hypothetical protein EVAR_62568_1 [Eumeta japonica]
MLFNQCKSNWSQSPEIKEPGGRRFVGGGEAGGLFSISASGAPSPGDKSVTLGPQCSSLHLECTLPPTVCYFPLPVLIWKIVDLGVDSGPSFHSSPGAAVGRVLVFALRLYCGPVVIDTWTGPAFSSPVTDLLCPHEFWGQANDEQKIVVLSNHIGLKIFICYSIPANNMSGGSHVSRATCASKVSAVSGASAPLPSPASAGAALVSPETLSRHSSPLHMKQHPAPSCSSHRVYMESPKR